MKKDFKRGFTLVELAVVILVLGIVIAFVVPAVTNKSDSTEMRAINTVSGYIAEYESNHTTDHVENVVVIHNADDTLFIFGYNFDEDVLYMFTGAWLIQAQGNVHNTTSGFAHVAANIVTSANNDSGSLIQSENPYPKAEGIFSGNTDLKDAFSSRTQKKMENNTLFIEAEINKDYTVMYGDIEYKVIRADGEAGDNTAAAEYTTVFMDEDGETELHSFSTAHEATFTCPEDPTESGKQFLYWNLVKVNDETKSIPGTALVPGEKYDVPNSDVVYKAVFDDDGIPEQKGGAYQLYGAKHLKWFADHVNNNNGGAKAKLVRSFKADNTLSSIGTKTYPYHGVFDGNGKTIFDLSMSAHGSNHHTALFAYTNGAEIKNLTLKNPTISGTTYVSALVAEAKASINGTTGAYTTDPTIITNCKIVGANITCADVTAPNDATDAEKETLAQAKIFKDRYEVQNVDVGGILTPTVVLTQAEQGTYCGGLVGFGENIEIKQCSVSGTIKGGNNGTAIGGIMGAACGTHVKIGTSGSDKVGASMDATVSGVRYVGGLIGKTVDSEQIAAVTPAVTVTTGVEIYNSYVAGEVTRHTSVMKLPEQSYLATSYTDYCIGFGGLVGGTKNSFLTITGCDTTKNAKVDPSVSDENNYTSTFVGGILGYAEKGEIEINTTKNNAPVAGRQTTGGIVGASRDVRLIITGCENNGEVVSRALCGGGILGYAKTTQTNTRAPKVVQIIDSTNNAKVSAPKRVGGILGEAERTVTLTGCTNNGGVNETTKNLYSVTVNDATGAGGIVGYSVGKLIITDCTNTATVQSSMQGVGGIVGKATTVTVNKTSDVPTVDDINGTTPAGDPAEVTLTSNLSEITNCTNTGAVKNIARTDDVTETPAPAVPTPTPDPEAEPTPTPTPAIEPYTYAGGIVGFADRVVLIDYCINASYVTGNTNVGGIAGTLVKPDATPAPVNPVVVTRDPDPEPTPTPTQSAIRHSISVGVVESQAAENGKAGAIIGSNDWAINYTRNVYLENMVQFTGTTPTEITQNVPPVGSENPPREYGTALASEKFMQPAETSGSALYILNGDIVAPDTPVYVLPDTSDPENQPTFAYKKSLTDAVAAYAALPTPVTITLPTFLPVFAEE